MPPPTPGRHPAWAGEGEVFEVRLEQIDTFDMDAVYAFCWRDTSNDHVNENSVETDEEFQFRWRMS